LAHKRIDSFVASGNWTCPSGITSIVVECWGAGGGGTTNVGAGGGGAYALKSLTVIPGNVYAVVVGIGATNADGGDSTFDSTACVAKGGLSGTNGGTGGASGSSTGDTVRSGGNGSIGTGTRGGGGGAGENAGGNNGTSGGVGGQGGAFTGGIGGSSATAGLLVGGGGGSAAAAQFAGARGEVRVSYDVAVTAGFPYISARSVTRGISDTTSQAITMPSGIVAGDLLVIIATADEAPTHSMTGWTQVSFTAFNAAFTVSQSIWYKIAVGGDTATLGLSATNVVTAVCMIIKDWGAVPTATSNNGNSTNADPPNHTAPVSANHLWLAVAGWDWNTAIGITPPTGYLDYFFVPGGATIGAGMAIADKFSTGSSENPPAYTSSTEQWTAWTIEIPGVLGNPYYYFMNQMAGQAA
jgi:hypothetical protein